MTIQLLPRRLAFALLAFTAIGRAQEYVGSEHCSSCHSAVYETWQQSGHHLALSSISGLPPEFPFQYHPGLTNVPTPPALSGSPLTWNEISYVVGGFYRGALFASADGYLVTGQPGDTTRWSVWDQRWDDYRPGQQLVLDCAECHATGYDSAGHQGGLPGVSGSWAEDGVGCEACHGPDS